MGNDIFSAFLNKKKSMILEYASSFFKYTVNNKNKINKTLENIIDIYIEDFYLNNDEDLSGLEQFFSLQKSKDKLLKETLFSTIKFYQLNNISEKIETDKGTIILISNVVYLGIVLSDKCFRNYNGDASILIENFLYKYRTKIRMKYEELVDEMKDSLVSLTRKNINSIKKSFKLFEGTNYSIDVHKILDYDNHYLIKPSYDIKLLSKYTEKEIKGAIDKTILIEHSLVSLEQTVLKVVYDFLNQNFYNRYFVKLPIEVFEKQKYLKMVEEIFKIHRLKENIVVVFDYNDIIDSNKTLEQLRMKRFVLSIDNINSLKINKNSFDNLDYVFTNRQFLEMYVGYQEIWSAKGINFIIS